MICENCGVKNDDKALFCENCGNPMLQVCPHCGNQLKPGVKFCNQCGTPLSPTDQSQDAERLADLQESTPSELKEKVRKATHRTEDERKPVTILFADVVGSTSLAEKLDPEVWKEIINGAHQRISKVVYAYEGTIAQLLGDGVLVFFGAPLSHEDDPFRAVRAALDIQETIGEYAQEVHYWIEDFQVRIGLNTGTVVVGSVGDDLHMEYLAVGDAVNLAARLQSAAQPGKVLISESTQRLVKSDFELLPVGELTLKGKAEAVAAFEVVECRSMAATGRGFDELYSPMVGRDDDRLLLLNAMQKLLHHSGQIVTVIGEAGIGKTRLVEEARIYLDSQTGGKKSTEGLRWLEGRALSYGTTLSFWSITQMLKDDLGILDADPELKIRLALRKRVTDLFGEDEASVFPYLASLLGIRLEGEMEQRVRTLDGETLKRQVMLSLTHYFVKLTLEQPTVLVFEDLHWADPSTLEVLEHLLPITNRAPLMLLLLTRPEREHGSWQIKLKAETDYPHRCTEIHVQPLTPDQQTQLMQQLLVICDLPYEVHNLILQRSEGNPFYLEEIVRSLIEQHAITRGEDGSWRASQDVLDITVPDTLQGILLARIDRLQEDVRLTLQLAAVIGRSFLYRLLQAISEAEAQLDQHLAILQQVDLVREKTHIPELEYIFKHSLTQEATYNSLLVERRREFHRLVGEQLEILFADQIDEYTGLLSHHFDAAGDREKAVSYLIQAGDRARMTDEHTEAVVYYQRALELLDELGDEQETARVWLKLGLVYHTNFQFDLAYRANEKAFALSQKPKHLNPKTQGKKQGVLRFGYSQNLCRLDPGHASFLLETIQLRLLFSGLVKLDKDLNLIPDVARSWQVLEDGTRYVFHLRDDIFWSNGEPVTAHDFERTWKRNLRPYFHSRMASFLFDIAGARSYRQGKNPDPDSVGVHALDDLRLEVHLEKPVAYFPFILSIAVTYPLPRTVIERDEDSWWLSGNMVSNGAFHLIEFDDDHIAMERNPYDQREVSGNLGRIEWHFYREKGEHLSAYREKLVDITPLGFAESPLTTEETECYTIAQPATQYLSLNPCFPPLDDLRVRKALMMSVDRQRLADELGIPSINGGVIPPQIPGHTPEIGLRYDLEAARKLLVEAGFPNGEGLPSLSVRTLKAINSICQCIASQWRDGLGIQVEVNDEDFLRALEHSQTVINYHVVGLGWTADYPDPDYFLKPYTLPRSLRLMGWRDDKYDQLVEEASHTTDRAKRMSMYRQVDRELVVEQALVLPATYNSSTYLVKPWIKNFKMTPLGYVITKDIIVEEH